jgi:lipopolysaccharide export system protein LptC
MNLKQAIIIMVSAALCGCGVSAQQRQQLVLERARMKEREKLAAIPGMFAGSGCLIPWRAPDPAHPNGSPISVLVARAAVGIVQVNGNAAVVKLQHVTALIYRNNRPAFKLTADAVTGNQGEMSVAAQGKVLFQSTNIPPNLRVTADRATWSRVSHLLTADGNVKAIRRQHGGPDIVRMGSHMVYNTENGELSY